MSEDAKRIGARIRAARERLGRNKNQMARDVGTSWQHVDRWEKGKTVPAPESLRKLSAYLGVTMDHLVADDAVGAESPGDALEEFLGSYAPRDLTGTELAWLKSAPLGRDATPGRYVDLLRALRAGGAAIVRVGDVPEDANSTKKPRSGTHAKVDRARALERAKKHG